MLSAPVLHALELMCENTPGGRQAAESHPGELCHGRRWPKTKYETGTTPAELTSATAAAHIPFRPRIWLAGRRWVAMSALRAPRSREGGTRPEGQGCAVT